MENLVQIAMQNVNLAAIMPSLVLVCFGMGLLLINVFLPRGTTRPAVWISLVGIAVTTGVVMQGWGNPQYGFSDAVALDNFATFFNVTFLVAAAMTILMSDDYLRREGYPVNEYYPLILFATVGAMWMASGTDLMTIFLGLEVMSISLYVLAGFFRGQVASNEAGLKYFLLGAFSTGFLLYGMALIYGVTGTTRLAEIGVYLRFPFVDPVQPDDRGRHGADAPSVSLFKLGAAPFHMWMPDVYRGCPDPHHRLHERRAQGCRLLPPSCVSPGVLLLQHEAGVDRDVLGAGGADHDDR